MHGEGSPVGEDAAPGPPAAPGVTLAGMARRCGLTVAADGAGSGTRRVRGIELFDPEAAGDLTDVVLAAPGHDLSGSGGASVVTRAERGGALALLVSEAQAGSATAHAPAALPLLTCPPGTAWADLIGHVRAVIASGDPDAAGRGWDLPHRDLVLLANTVAERVGGSVTIFNPQQEVIASSRVREGDDQLRRQAVLDQHGPRWYREHLRARGVYAELWAGEDVVAVPPIPERRVGRRLAVAVRAGDEILGSLWVAEGDTPLPADAAETLRQAARAAALRLIELHEQGRAGRRAGEEAARAVMTGQGSLDAACTRIGADIGLPCAVVAVEPTGSMRFSARRLSEALALHASAYRWTAASVGRGERRVDMLLCNLADASTGPVRRMVEAFVRDCEHTALGRLRAGVGPVVRLDRAAESAAVADLVLQVLRQSSSSGVATRDDTWASVGLLRLGTAMERMELPCEPLRELVRMDGEHRTDLVKTLRVYLQCLGDVRSASRRLNVHVNTVRYRLRRVRDLTGLDLDDPDQRLFVWLQLRNGGPVPTSYG